MVTAPMPQLCPSLLTQRDQLHQSENKSAAIQPSVFACILISDGLHLFVLFIDTFRLLGQLTSPITDTN